MRKFDKKTTFLIVFILTVTLIQLFSSGWLPKSESDKKIDFYGGIEKAPLYLLDIDDAIERCEKRKWNEECYDWFSNTKNLEIWSKSTVLKIFNSYRSKSKFNCFNHGWLYRSLTGVGISEPLVNITILNHDLTTFCLEKSCSVACKTLGIFTRHSAEKIKVVEAALWFYLADHYGKKRPLNNLASPEIKNLRIGKEAFTLFAKRANRDRLRGHLSRNELEKITKIYYSPMGALKD